MKKGYGGGISLLEGYRLDRTVITEKDIENILMSVEAMGPTHYRRSKALEKLSALFRQHRAANWVEIDFTEWDTDKRQDTRNECDKGKGGRGVLVKNAPFSSYYLQEYSL